MFVLKAIKDQRTSLKSLTLRNNDIGPIGLTALANALESPNNLENLVVFGNRFDNDNGIQYLDIITHRTPYTGLKIDISVYVVDGKYMIAEN